jgi:hypothetical protein
VKRATLHQQSTAKKAPANGSNASRNGWRMVGFSNNLDPNRKNMPADFKYETFRFRDLLNKERRSTLEEIRNP